VQILAGTTANATSTTTQQLAIEDLRKLQRFVREVLCGNHLLQFTAELISATHPESPTASDRMKRFVRYGASARAGQAIVLGAKARALLAGRPAVTKDDILACVLPALRHRVLLGYEAESVGTGVPELLQEWMQTADKRVR